MLRRVTRTGAWVLVDVAFYVSLESRKIIHEVGKWLALFLLLPIWQHATHRSTTSAANEACLASITRDVNLQSNFPFQSNRCELVAARHIIWIPSQLPQYPLIPLDLPYALITRLPTLPYRWHGYVSMELASLKTETFGFRYEWLAFLLLLMLFGGDQAYCWYGHVLPFLGWWWVVNCTGIWRSLVELASIRRPIRVMDIL